MTKQRVTKITCDGCGWIIYKKIDNQVIRGDKPTEIEILENGDVKSSFHLCPWCLEDWKENNIEFFGGGADE